MNEMEVAIREFYGDLPRRSSWLTVDQDVMNKFGAATLDCDWLHTDPDRARRESPFGGTIAFGFWTLALLTYFGREIYGADYPAGARYGLNYGFDRVRMTAPILVGKRIRAEVRLREVHLREKQQYLVKSEYKIEVEGEQKPAMIAEWLCLLAF